MRELRKNIGRNQERYHHAKYCTHKRFLKLSLSSHNFDIRILLTKRLVVSQPEFPFHNNVVSSSFLLLGRLFTLKLLQTQFTCPRMKLEMVLTIPQQIPSEDVGRSDHSGWTSDSTVSSESLQALDQSGNDSSFCTTCYDSIINCTSDSDLCEASSLGYPFTKITKFWGSLAPFVKFRLQYILAYIGIMLADGLQGTKLEI